MLIAGDIGGTKASLALYDLQNGARHPIHQRTYHSADHAGLAEIVRDFLTTTDQPVKVGCFAVAAPVIAGLARFTNLPWVVDEASLCRDLGLERVTLLNDLQALAYAVPHLRDDDVHVLNAGIAVPRGPIGVIAPGTGLGEAFLVWAGDRYLACASEGGHPDFSPANDTQAAMLAYLQQRHAHVSYEMVCSGLGLPNIYGFLRDGGDHTEPPEFAAELAAADDRTPLILQAALQPGPAHRLCAVALDIFIACLGAEAGNLALKVLATGGIYFGGGIPPRILPQLDDGRLLSAFTAKGRYHDMLQNIPLKIVTSSAGLLGAALYGLDDLRHT